MTISSTDSPSATTTHAASTSAPKPGGFDMDAFRQILRERYLEWVDMPEAERIRHHYLESHGLDEASLDLLPAAEKAAHEEKISERTKQPQLSIAIENTDQDNAFQRPVLTLQSVLELAHTVEGEEAADHTFLGNTSSKPAD
ncbi:hypothetical protein [Roseibium sp.]|uniref:hypothetical protein n=1 Tax=Roseibium sp. TaxID=1936156 RepID=UPI003A972CE0